MNGNSQEPADVRLIELVPGLTEAEIVIWHVAVGDHVVAGEPLVAVATEDAVLEVRAPGSGRITSIARHPGDRLQVGDLLARLDSVSADGGTVVGELPDDPPAFNDKEPSQ